MIVKMQPKRFLNFSASGICVFTLVTSSSSNADHSSSIANLVHVLISIYTGFVTLCKSQLAENSHNFCVPEKVLSYIGQRYFLT